ncbi:uncharacterized protein SOCEGT47_005750 [Sorangium cellulosum]|uniref:Uncharacterized protein n=1 Tax=Sorangium cellulosum TaxID=56 RepID=A0A4V0NCR7_SORCE|nr:uncharacterized protein SOCEGT47_005750 [Sorangium cellulosum]
MPTLEHNALVEMFRERPELAPHVLATLFHVEVPPHASVAVVESSLDQLIPAELRADLVLELRDASGKLVLAIVLEVQRNVDPNKKFSWPTYVTGVRARKRCATVVLVVAPDAGVAAWAAESIDLGLGLGTIKPLVLGPAVVPEITDPAVAEAEEAEMETELAVLSAVAHGNGPNGSPCSRRRSLPWVGSTKSTRWSIFNSSGTGCANPCSRLWRRWSWNGRSKERRLSPRSCRGSSIAASSRACVRANSRACVRASSRACVRANSRARRKPSCGCLRAQGSCSPRTRARASRHARTSRPSTAGSRTSSGRRLRPKCSPDGRPRRPSEMAFSAEELVGRKGHGFAPMIP